MRHRLPHAWGTGRGMQVLLFPLRTFGDGGTRELADGGIPARARLNPIAACINHARYVAVAFRLDFGGHGHAANLIIPAPSRAPALRGRSALRRSARSNHTRADPLSPRRTRPVGEGRGAQHLDDSGS